MLNTAGPSTSTPISAASHSRSSMPWTLRYWGRAIRGSWILLALELSLILVMDSSSLHCPSTPSASGRTSDLRPSFDLWWLCRLEFWSVRMSSSKMWPTTAERWLSNYQEAEWWATTRTSTVKSSWSTCWTPPSDCQSHWRTNDYSNQISPAPTPPAYPIIYRYWSLRVNWIEGSVVMGYYGVDNYIERLFWNNKMKDNDRDIKRRKLP